MPKTIIADTSCFIILCKIGELDILNSGLIQSIKPFIAKINKTDFRMTTELVNQALKEAEEL